MIRIGVDRVLKFAFELRCSAAAQEAHLGDQEQRHLDHHAVLGRARRGDGEALPAGRGRSLPHRHPRRAFRAAAAAFDVVVASNLFGDILSDLGPACTGTIGIAPSANLNPTREHGRRCSSRCTARRPTSPGAASPTRSGRSGRRALMLEFLGHRDAHDAILRAIEPVLEPASGAPRTPDLGGSAAHGGPRSRDVRGAVKARGAQLCTLCAHGVRQARKPCEPSGSLRIESASALDTAEGHGCNRSRCCGAACAARPTPSKILETPFEGELREQIRTDRAHRQAGRHLQGGGDARAGGDDRRRQIDAEEEWQRVAGRVRHLHVSASAPRAPVATRAPAPRSRSRPPRCRSSAPARRSRTRSTEAADSGIASAAGA